MNTERFGKSWNWSRISVRSSLPISAYMWNISTWSAKNFVSHHIKWRTSPGSGQNSTAFSGGGALGSVFSFLSSGRSVSLDLSSWSGLQFSAGSCTTIDKNVSLSHRKIGDSTQVMSSHSWCHCPETLLWCSVSPNTNEKYACCHLSTLPAPEAPHKVYLSTRVFPCACSSSVHSKSIRCAFSFGIRTSGFPLAGFDYDHRHMVHGFAVWIIRCTTSCWASSSLVWIACIQLFTAKYNASAPCFSITVSFSGSSGTGENSHIVWKHQAQSEWNPSVAVTWSLNPILAFIAICQPTPFKSYSDWTYQKSWNSMNTRRVGSYLMVSLWMLRYHTK